MKRIRGKRDIRGIGGIREIEETGKLNLRLKLPFSFISLNY
jgi:hypothetical protein